MQRSLDLSVSPQRLESEVGERILFPACKLVRRERSGTRQRRACRRPVGFHKITEANSDG
eukprot:596643-Hanusia_phi.AAC.2